MGGIRRFHSRLIPVRRATARSNPLLRLASGTCGRCSPRSRNFARSAGSPDVVQIGGASPPVISAWTLSWPALDPPLGGSLCRCDVQRRRPVEIIPGHRERHSGIRENRSGMEEASCAALYSLALAFWDSSPSRRAQPYSRPTPH